MRFDPFGVTFHTAYDKAKCKEIISACTVKGAEGWPMFLSIKDLSGNDRIEDDRKSVSVLRGDRIFSILRGDRIKLFPSNFPFRGSLAPRGGWMPYFTGELQSSSEGTIIAGRIRFPTIAVLGFAFGFALFCIFAFLGIFGLIVAVVSGYLADPPGITISELKMPFLLTLPFQVVVLFLIHGYFQTRKQFEDIFDIFMVELKAKRRS